jgi:preprotein translocase subunit SecA
MLTLKLDLLQTLSLAAVLYLIGLQLRQRVAWLDRLNIPEDVPIESKMVSRAIRSAQTQVEQQNFEIRKNVLKYDEVLNRQRTVIYDERRKVLEGADLHEQIRNMLDDVIEGYVTAATAEGYPEDWDLEQLWTDLKQIWPVSLDLQQLLDEHDGAANVDRDELISKLQADAQAAYDAREAEVGEEVMRELERRVLLSVLDRKWREHLYEMDYLREGIYLRAYSQRDPLVEYQREGFEMFATMMDGIKEESVGFLFNLEVQVEEEPDPHAGHDHAHDHSGEFGGVFDGLANGAPVLDVEKPQVPQIRAKGLDARPVVDGGMNDWPARGATAVTFRRCGSG